MGMIIKRVCTAYHILNVYLTTESAYNTPDGTHYLYNIHTSFQSSNIADNLENSIFGSE